MPTTLPSEGQAQSSPTPIRPPSTASPDSSAKLRHSLISLSAAVMFFSFFLPWVTFLGAKLNGLDIQKNFSSYRLVWVIPLVAVLVLVLNMARQNTSFIRRIAGLCPFAVLVYAMNCLGSELPKVLEFGAWLALLAGTALVLIPGERRPATPV